MSATQYYALRNGRVFNAVMTAERDRKVIAGMFEGDVEIKTEDELSQAQLAAYEFWATRP